jgi:hypothetical protein
MRLRKLKCAELNAIVIRSNCLPNNFSYKIELKNLVSFFNVLILRLHHKKGISLHAYFLPNAITQKFSLHHNRFLKRYL